MSNFSIILVPGILSIILGIFFITLINPITAVLVKKYESIKKCLLTKKIKIILAAITENGIWIKEKNLEKNYIIKATSLKNKELVNVTIYEFDNNNNFIKRIESEFVDISSQNWILINSTAIDKNGKDISDDIENLKYTKAYMMLK